MNADFLKEYEFFTGVPDSQLKPLCNWLFATYGISDQHVIAANEGNAVALAAGYHLATGKIPVVYMQNSGIGNAVNPVASLLNDKVYAIPCVFVIGWRGEPGLHDEPQHVFQGEATLPLLKDMGIEAYVIDKTTTQEQLAQVKASFDVLLQQGKQVAYVVKKGALSFEGKVNYQNPNPMTREEIIGYIARISQSDPIVSTTGKASRELFELREAMGDTHGKDFLTVGSMGHCSSIAMGIALAKPQQKVWIVDGDGAVLMHLGAMALLGARKPQNLVHVVINNAAHETVGGMPTVAGQIDLVQIARGCGYPNARRVSTPQELQQALEQAKAAGELSFLEVTCAIGAREDLGRPTTTARENKEAFMQYLKNI